jgi:hypothetical protein
LFSSALPTVKSFALDDEFASFHGKAKTLHEKELRQAQYGSVNDWALHQNKTKLVIPSAARDLLFSWSRDVVEGT